MVHDAVDEIMRHEDHRQFFSCMRLNINHYFDDKKIIDSLPGDATTSLAIILGYGIWNAMPPLYNMPVLALDKHSLCLSVECLGLSRNYHFSLTSSPLSSI